MKRLEAVKAIIAATKTRSQWSKGVKEYAEEILESVEERAEYEGREPETESELIDYMLNGAKDYSKPRDIFAAWKVYSHGGSSLIYNGDICARLATISEQKRTRNGEKDPNSRESWLDCQGRALFQAGEMIRRAYREADKA